MLSEAEALPLDHPDAVAVQRATASLYKTVKVRRRNERREAILAHDRAITAATATGAPGRIDDETEGLPLVSSVKGAVAGELMESRACYVCKQRYTTVDAFYHQLCPGCAGANHGRREARTDLTGRRALLTGGRAKIGMHIALRLLRDGARLTITTRFPNDAVRRFAQMADSGEWLHRLKIVGIDLRDPAQVVALADAVADDGPLDVLINNAGIMPLGRFVDEDDATARRMVDINLHGLMFGMKLVLPSMQRRNTGHIVNIASQAGKGGFPGGATYCATKHAVVGLSEAVRGELVDTDIEISCVMPAAVNTELAAGLVEARGVKKIEPQDVADAVVDALKFPKFDVWVPKVSDAIFRVMTLLPRRGREVIVRALKADQVLAGADSHARAAYEDRASRSEPGIAPERAGAAADAAAAEKVESG